MKGLLTAAKRLPYDNVEEEIVGMVSGKIGKVLKKSTDLMGAGT